MQLEFVKRGNNYEAIFEVTSDFNIHIELNKPSYLGVYQSGIQNGEYSFATEYKLNDIQKIYDIDFGALVYPKYIKVVSGSEVVSASVNFNEGGGSGSGSGESSGEAFTFFDVKGKIPDNTMATLYGYIVKIDDGETQDVLSGSYAYSLVGLENISKKWVAMGIPNNTLILNPSGGGLINSDKIISMFEANLGWTRITKEQFYNLET